MLHKVLIVDDSPTMRNLVTLLLNKANFEVESAADGVEGLAKFSNFEADVVIADINMPRMNGYQMMAAIRSGSVRNKVPIVALTTETSEVAKSQMKDAGASAWVAKPYDDDVLIKVVRQFTS